MRDLSELLRLERPLCAIDLETTGVNHERDRVIQIGIAMFYPDRPPVEWKTFVDPEMAIPAEIQQKVKITDADVAGAPTFRSLAPGLARRLVGVDFAGYNVDFDLRFTRAEMRRAGVAWDFESDGVAIVDAKIIFFRFHPRTLEDCYKEYVDPAGFAGAHDAGNDVAATVDALAGQLGRHPELPLTALSLSAWCFPVDESWVDKAGKITWRNKEACIGFGKHAGTPLTTMDKGYLRWMIKSDFPAATKKILEEALAGRFPKWIPRG